MTPFSPSRLLAFRRLAPLLGARTVWGLVCGALLSLVLCAAVALMSAQMSFYNQAITIVWTLQSDKALWRGAMLGLLIGWLGRTPKQAQKVCAFGFVLLILNDWREQRAAFMPFNHLFDLNVTLQYLLYALIMSALTFRALQTLSPERQRDAAPNPSTTTDTTVEISTG